MKIPRINLAGCNVLSARTRRDKISSAYGRISSKFPPASPPRDARYFLNSFHPLCETERGQIIAAQHHIPPFVDYSIRREPDFQHPFLSVTGLCRCDMLVGQAAEGDFVAYVTVKSAGPRRLVAILQVLHKLSSHAMAADWYRRQGLHLPTNCIVHGNEALPLELAVPPNNFTTYSAWKGAYRWRSENFPSFLVCRAVAGPELYHPPVVLDNIFGRPFPNTRSPKQLTRAEFAKLRRLLP